MKVPKFLKNVGKILVIGLIILNIYSISYFRVTVVAMSKYFIVSLYGSGIIFLLLVLYTVVAASFDTEKKVQRVKPFLIVLGAFMSFTWYHILIGFTPFYINSLQGSDATLVKGKNVSIATDINVVYAEDDMQTEISSYEHYDYTFEFKTFSFSTSGDIDDGRQKIEFVTKIGLFGWEYIDEVRLK